jgi:hypothetical protein
LENEPKFILGLNLGIDILEGGDVNRCAAGCSGVQSLNYFVVQEILKIVIHGSKQFY